MFRVDIMSKLNKDNVTYPGPKLKFSLIPTIETFEQSNCGHSSWEQVPWVKKVVMTADIISGKIPYGSERVISSYKR